MRIALAIAVAISACGKASPPDVTTGSAIDDVSDIPFDAMMSAYTFGIIQSLSEWDGDCAKQLDRMRGLDILMREIHDGEARVPPALLAQGKAQMVAGRERLLADWQKTVGELGATESEIEVTCKGRGADEMNKIFAVMKSP
jgi:hypothetical protein